MATNEVPSWSGEPLIRIRRDEALEKLRAHLDKENHCACCSERLSLERFSRFRNYEIEERLEVAFKEKFVVAELCPFNGEFCRWGSLSKNESSTP